MSKNNIKLVVGCDEVLDVEIPEGYAICHGLKIKDGDLYYEPRLQQFYDCKSHGKIGNDVSAYYLIIRPITKTPAQLWKEAEALEPGYALDAIVMKHYPALVHAQPSTCRPDAATLLSLLMDEATSVQLSKGQNGTKIFLTSIGYGEGGDFCEIVCKAAIYHALYGRKAG